MFTAGLLVRTLISCLKKSFDHDFGYFRGQETLAPGNSFHCFRENLREIGFQDVPMSPCSQCTSHHLV